MILLRTVALVVLVTIPHTAWATPIVIQEVLYDAPRVPMLPSRLPSSWDHRASVSMDGPSSV